ncbi:helix-turn-helix transcriptional regulator [Gordonia sp. 852002-51296_SCH5728562-b]|uniref:helix-turn-helix transcriptional regulator n=1 Tax=Gordonia sp. 852002-51296_SCH5728562-b TaxID=1834101 RepID=UPI000AC436BA|nr:DNA-binding protein [Gordonia sp. 852002-51296_SCH5728562-b]
MNDHKQLTMSPKTLGRSLDRSTGTLKNWRMRGIGPPYIKTSDGGSVLYRIEDVTAWLEERAAATAGTPAA